MNKEEIYSHTVELIMDELIRLSPNPYRILIGDVITYGMGKLDANKLVYLWQKAGPLNASLQDMIEKSQWKIAFNSHLCTNDVFIQKTTDNLLAKHTGMFAGIYNTVPVVSLTNRDKLNGNSYSVTTKIFGNVAKTECVHNTEVFRNDTL